MKTPARIIRGRLRSATEAYSAPGEILRSLRELKRKLISDHQRTRRALAERVGSFRTRWRAKKEKALLRAVALLHAQADEHMRRLEADFRAEALEIVRSICRTVLREELTVEPKSLARRISLALESLPQHRTAQASLVVHPDDREAAGKELKSIPITVSERITRGNAIVELPFGRIEIAWEDHLNQLIDALSQKSTGGRDARVP